MSGSSGTSSLGFDEATIHYYQIRLDKYFYLTNSKNKWLVVDVSKSIHSFVWRKKHSKPTKEDFWIVLWSPGFRLLANDAKKYKLQWVEILYCIILLLTMLFVMMLLSQVVDHYHYTSSDYLSIAMAAIVRTEATIDKWDMKLVRRQKLVPNCQSL